MFLGGLMKILLANAFKAPPQQKGANVSTTLYEDRKDPCLRAVHSDAGAGLARKGGDASQSDAGL